MNVCGDFVNWPTRDADHLIVSDEQMDTLEKDVFVHGMPVAALMEKAGLLISRWILKRSDLIQEGVVVLVGPGHNGGDGLVVARELYLQGVKVSIWCPIQITKELTAHHFSYAKWIGIEILETPPATNSNLLWIEALFGLGQSRPLPKEISSLLIARQVNCPGRLISLDVPAGMCSNQGIAFNGVAATAAYSLSIGLIKKGMLQDSALKYVGNLVRIDIGFNQHSLEKLPKTQSFRICSKDLNTFKLPKLPLEASKYQRGKVMIFAGSNKYRGAGLLAINGALASGAGSVNAFVPKIIADSLWNISPEVILEGELNSSSDGSSLINEKLQNVDFDRFDSLLIGPGIGIGKESWDDFSCPLESFPGILVLDADALNRLSTSSQGWKWLHKRKGPTCITPHRKEFNRLFPCIDSSLSLLDAAIEAASISRSIIVLKGAHTVIADPLGNSWQIGKSIPFVARAGLGDVLAGFVSGIGSIGIAANHSVDGQLISGAVLIHSNAANSCVKGSTASAISVHLGRILKELQINQMS